MGGTQSDGRSAVDGSNRQMRQVWDGEVGRRWVEDLHRYERMNAPFGSALMTAAAIRPGEVVLDVGCGAGARTLDAVRAGARALGVDISGRLLEVAARRAVDMELETAAFRQVDAQVDDLGAEVFDVAISQFGVMFFADPVAAFANIASALRPGGRLVFACWQELNNQQRLMVPLAAALDHVPVPGFSEDDWSNAAFSMSDPDVIDWVLAEAGFTRFSATPMVAPQWQGADLADVMSFLRGSEFADSVFAKADTGDAIAGWDAVASALMPYVERDGVLLDGAAWLVSAVRQ